MRDYRVVFPGSFDPLTLGHEHLIARAASIFSTVIVGVADSARKAPLFSAQERVALAQKVLAPYRNVVVLSFSNLLVDFVRAQGAQAVVRGVRTTQDFEYELQLAHMNHALSQGIETLFLPPWQHAFVASSLVKEIAHMQGDVSAFVSPIIVQALKEKLQ